MQDIEGFSSPDVDLEQYPTSAEIASRMLFTVGLASRYLRVLLARWGTHILILCLQVESVYNDFAGRSVVDLGCGTVSSQCRNQIPC